MKLTQEQIDKAVDWWKSVFVNPKFDNGDDSRTGQTTQMLAIMATVPPTEEQLAKFDELMRAKLNSDNPFYCDELKRTLPSCFTVDYHPDSILRSLLVESGISPTNAPWKTRMYFDNEQVSVVYGYSAKEEVL